MIIQKLSNSSQRNVVYDVKSESPTLQSAMGNGGGNTPLIIIVAMRGRDKTNPNHRGKANENYEQRLEPNKEGISNTITTIQKDNMALEYFALRTVRTEEGKRLRKAYENHEINCRFSEHKEYEPRPDGVCNTLSTVQKDNYVLIKQATKQGTIPCVIGGVADLNYVGSKTRRGRVQDEGRTCPTLTTENIPSVLEPYIYEIDGELYLIRIRKLTPRECWRLMSFSDSDFEKAQAVNSNTQLYAQAGNSIVEDCLKYIFAELL